MGEVYRAHDEVLDRDVAIKVLPQGVAKDPQRLERFEREAKAVARLSHPNILAIFDFSIEADTTYAVMELLEGESLRQALAAGKLPWRRAHGIAVHVAEGLAAAHAKGIVHRDLKPENIFLTDDGQVKILDFGLARLEPTAEEEVDTEGPTMAMTRQGTVLGTVGYMSPEQVRGEPADAKSDIFALGCVIFEMVSGRQPFKRDTAVETMASILKEDPAPFADTGMVVSNELRQVIERCLEKRPARRFQSASDLSFALRAITGESEVRTSVWSLIVPPPRTRRIAKVLMLGATVAVVGVGIWMLMVGRAPGGGKGEKPTSQVSPVEPNRVAVLPFENRTGDPTLDRFSESIANEIARGLTELADISVAPSGVVATAVAGARKSGEDPISEVTRSTRSGLSISGGYELQGDSIRFWTELTDQTNGELLRSLQSESSGLTDTSAALAELEQRLTSAVWIHRNGFPGVGLQHFSHVPLYGAVRELQAGNEAIARGDGGGAFRHYSVAVDMDPEFFAAKMELISLLVGVRQWEEAEVMLEDLGSRRNALTELERLWMDSMTAWMYWKTADALRLLREMEGLVPDSPEVRFWHAFTAAAFGRPREALEAASELQGEDLLKSVGRHIVSAELDSLHMLGRYDEEIELARATREHMPTRAEILYRAEIRAQAARGDSDSIERLLNEAAVRLPDSSRLGQLTVDAAWLLKAQGMEDKARVLAERLIQWVEDRGSPPEHRALVGDAHWLLGRNEEARQVFEQLANERIGLGGSDTIWAVSRAGILAAVMGDEPDARRALDEVRQEEVEYWPGRRRYHQASILAYLGEQERAISLLRESLAEGVFYILLFDNPANTFPLRDDPGFQELLQPEG